MSKNFLNDFSYGEMNGELSDRIDLDTYNKSAKFMENFDPNIFGNLKKRRGSKELYTLQFNSESDRIYDYDTNDDQTKYQPVEYSIPYGQQGEGFTMDLRADYADKHGTITIRPLLTTFMDFSIDNQLTRFTRKSRGSLTSHYDISWAYAFPVLNAGSNIKTASQVERGVDAVNDVNVVAGVSPSGMVSAIGEYSSRKSNVPNTQSFSPPPLSVVSRAVAYKESKITVQGSNDNVNWTDLQTFKYSYDSINPYIFNIARGVSNYRYYRVISKEADIDMAFTIKTDMYKAGELPSGKTYQIDNTVRLLSTYGASISPTGALAAVPILDHTNLFLTKSSAESEARRLVISQLRLDCSTPLIDKIEKYNTLEVDSYGTEGGRYFFQDFISPVLWADREDYASFYYETNPSELVDGLIIKTTDDGLLYQYSTATKEWALYTGAGTESKTFNGLDYAYDEFMDTFTEVEPAYVITSSNPKNISVNGLLYVASGMTSADCVLFTPYYTYEIDIMDGGRGNKDITVVDGAGADITADFNISITDGVLTAMTTAKQFLNPVEISIKPIFYTADIEITSATENANETSLWSGAVGNEGISITLDDIIEDEILVYNRSITSIPVGLLATEFLQYTLQLANISSHQMIPFYYDVDASYIAIMGTDVISFYNTYDGSISTLDIKLFNIPSVEFIQYCQLENKLIIASKNFMPKVITYDVLNKNFTMANMTDIMGWQMPRSLITEKKCDNIPNWLFFTKATGSVQCRTIVQSGEGKYNPDDGQNVFTADMVGGFITDGSYKFMITKYLRPSRVDGFWLIAPADTTTPDMEGIVWGENDDRKYWIVSGAEDCFTPTNGYPSACAVYEQRLYLGGTYKQPLTLWKSRINSYFNFNQATGLSEDAGELTINNPIGNDRIRSLFSNQGLTALSRNAEWFIPEASNGETIKRVGTMGINEWSRPVANNIYALYLIGANNNIGNLRQGSFYDRQVSVLFTQDCNTTLNNPYKICATINRTEGNVLYGLNRDGTLFKGHFLLTDEGKKIAFARYRAEQYNIIDICNLEREVYAITDTYRLIQLDYNTTLDSEIEGVIDGTTFKDTRLILGHSYALYHVLSDKYYLNLICDVNNTLTLPENLSGAVFVGYNFNARYTGNRIVFEHEATQSLKRIVAADFHVDGKNLKLRVGNKTFTRLDDRREILRCQNVGGFNRSEALNIEIDYPFNSNIKSVAIEVVGGSQ